MMETIEKLPSGKYVVGAKEVAKGIKAGQIKTVIFANNCPEFLVKRISGAGNVETHAFSGDQKMLGTHLGKPFPVALVGYE